MKQLGHLCKIQYISIKPDVKPGTMPSVVHPIRWREFLALQRPAHGREAVAEETDPRSITAQGASIHQLIDGRKGHAALRLRGGRPEHAVLAGLQKFSERDVANKRISILNMAKNARLPEITMTAFDPVLARLIFKNISAHKKKI